MSDKKDREKNIRSSSMVLRVLVPGTWGGRGSHEQRRPFVRPSDQFGGGGACAQEGMSGHIVGAAEK